ALDAALVPAASSSITGLVSYTPVRVPACAPGQCPLAGVTVTVALGDTQHTATTASTPAGDRQVHGGRAPGRGVHRLLRQGGVRHPDPAGDVGRGPARHRQRRTPAPAGNGLRH